MYGTLPYYLLVSSVENDLIIPSKMVNNKYHTLKTSSCHPDNVHMCNN